MCTETTLPISVQITSVSVAENEMQGKKMSKQMQHRLQQKQARDKYAASPLKSKVDWKVNEVEKDIGLWSRLFSPQSVICLLDQPKIRF